MSFKSLIKKRKTTGTSSISKSKFAKLDKRTRAHDIQTEYNASDVNNIQITATYKDGILEFTTKGRWISLNFIMTKSHWAKDSGIKEVTKKKVREAVKGLDAKLSDFVIVLRYNSRLDDHNTVMMPKYFTDSIKHNWLKNKNGRILVDEKGQRIVEYQGIIIEDNKNFSKGTLLIPDATLPHDTYIMRYVPYEKIKEEMSRL
jgi:hypothetical protein